MKKQLYTTFLVSAAILGAQTTFAQEGSMNTSVNTRIEIKNLKLK